MINKSSDSVKVSRILHAGYLFECKGTKIIFDPLFENPFSQNCFAFPEVQFDQHQIRQLKVDAIFISHYHDDHFSMDSLNLLDRQTPIYLFTIYDELILLLRELGFSCVHTIEIGKPVTIGEFEVRPIEALDCDVDSLYHLRAAGVNILNVVDSWISPAIMEKYLLTERWDLVLWPFQTMRELEVIAPSCAEPVSEKTYELPEEWIQQLRQLQPKAIVPSSCQFRFEEWSWYNDVFFPISYASFEKQVRHVLPQTQIIKLHPGESLLLDALGIQKSERLPWIHPVGVQDVDYQFHPHAVPQPIFEIAKKFLPLRNEQKNQILQYCQNQIVQKFQSLPVMDDSCFAREQDWQLVIYDHLGSSQSFQYKIFQNQIESVPLSGEWTWKTEIAEAKLWGAMMDGESLTSIYIRIVPAIDADPLEDPLVRCLYEGDLGSYQKAQLKKLKENFQQEKESFSAEMIENKITNSFS